ncbi:MAG: penicillin-binding protein activator LpoB [Muribaculum sp.]|nr:penicillin-binding protein activator LpoB [Muribaculum sp.]
MMKKLVIVLLALLSFAGKIIAQNDTRPVVGVAEFSCQENSPYTGLVTEKVVEMLTNTKRFRVVDRTSHDKIHAELELQKSEAFMDSKNLVEQDIAVAAEKMITGHIVKIPVYRMKNSDGSVRGFKASVGFEMKLVDVATGLSSEATSFQGKASQECLSPEAAVTMAMTSIQNEISEWFKVNFPVTCTISKILDNKTVLVKGGIAQGVMPGNTLLVDVVEQIDGMPYHQTIGEIKVQKSSGQYFSECSVPSKVMSAIKTNFDNASNIVCTLKTSK